MPSFKNLPPYSEIAGQLMWPTLKRSWSMCEIVDLFPNEGIDILDLGAGENKFPARPQDRLVTVDFDEGNNATVTTDFTKEWVFEAQAFDFIYASHVIEHLYPRDRDRIVSSIHHSLREGGLFFIRVPHRSSIQSTGWEHQSMYGTNGAMGLCHGKNPMLPVFDQVSAGVWTGGAGDVRMRQRPRLQGLIEKILNKSFRLTDRYLCYVLGGISEVQFLLRRLPADMEKRWFDKG